MNMLAVPAASITAGALASAVGQVVEIPPGTPAWVATAVVLFGMFLQYLNWKSKENAAEHDRKLAASKVEHEQAMERLDKTLASEREAADRYREASEKQTESNREIFGAIRELGTKIGEMSGAILASSSAK